MAKEKKCCGTGRAKGYGCNEPLPYIIKNGIKTYNAKYGLGKDCRCYTNWLISDEPKAKEVFNSLLLNNKKNYRKTQKAKIKKQYDEITSSKAMKLADTYFSRYIRLYFSIDGFCTCYTCGKVKRVLDIDNGHYMKREHKSTRFEFNNCRPQCKTCNGDIKHNGKQIEFRENLVNEIGLVNVENIESLSKQTIKANGLFYRKIADEYRIKINELQKELKVKYW